MLGGGGKREKDFGFCIMEAVSETHLHTDSVWEYQRDPINGLEFHCDSDGYTECLFVVTSMEGGKKGGREG